MTTTATEDLLKIGIDAIRAKLAEEAKQDLDLFPSEGNHFRVTIERVPSEHSYGLFVIRFVLNGEKVEVRARIRACFDPEGQREEARRIVGEVAEAVAARLLLPLSEQILKLIAPKP